jgi:hypothetical protein
MENFCEHGRTGRFNASHSWALFKTSRDMVDFGYQQSSNKRPTERKWKRDASQNSQVLQHQRDSRILLIRRVAEVSRNTFSFCDVICDENPDRTATI